MVKVKFICAKCGSESWFEANLDTYIITAMDLICDDCNLTLEDYEVK